MMVVDRSGNRECVEMVDGKIGKFVRSRQYRMRPGSQAVSWSPTKEGGLMVFSGDRKSVV